MGRDQIDHPLQSKEDDIIKSFLQEREEALEKKAALL